MFNTLLPQLRYRPWSSEPNWCCSLRPEFRSRCGGLLGQRESERESECVHVHSRGVTITFLVFSTPWRLNNILSTLQLFFTRGKHIRSAEDFQSTSETVTALLRPDIPACQDPWHSKENAAAECTRIVQVKHSCCQMYLVRTRCAAD